jgi:hypothetical protein
MQVTKQIRGNCQCCGRDQAVKNGTMAKHGYTVEHGWFNGVCSGERFAPIQVSRTQTDKIIAEILAEIPQLLAKAEQVVMGKLFPQFVVVGRYDNRKTIPYADADVRDQRHACEQMVWELRNRASAGKTFTETLTSIANEYHGKPLTEVAKKEAPTPIGINEVKIMNGCRIVSTSVYGGKVNYKPEGLDTAWSSYVSTTKWRNLKTA